MQRRRRQKIHNIFFQSLEELSELDSKDDVKEFIEDNLIYFDNLI